MTATSETDTGGIPYRHRLHRAVVDRRRIHRAALLSTGRAGRRWGADQRLVQRLSLDRHHHRLPANGPVWAALDRGAMTSSGTVLRLHHG
jgi:hypothetical protein